VGSSTTWFDTVGTASSLKLVLNTWLLGLLSAKDAELVRAAVAQAGGQLGGADAVAAILRRAVDAGHGDADMAAVVEVLRDS